MYTNTSMKLTLLLLSAFLAFGQIRTDAPAFTIDRQYVYKYNSRAANGIPEKGIMQFAGLGIKGDVIIQNQGSYVFIQFDNVEIGGFNQKFSVEFEEEFPITYYSVAERDVKLNTILKKPVRVTVEKGIVKSFDAYPDDPEWSINIKKAIISLFQLNFDRIDYIRFSKSNYLKPEDSTNFYRVMEDGVGGECETVYQISSLPYFKNPYEQVLNVTKHKIYDKCSHRPFKFFTTHMGYKCSDCEAYSFKPLTVDSETSYQIRGNRYYYTIEKINNIGRFIFTPFTTQSETIYSGVNQTLNFFETTAINDPIKFPQKYVTYTTLSYNMIATPENPYGVDLKKFNYADIPVENSFTKHKEVIGTLLPKIAEEHQLTDDLHDEHDVPEKFMILVDTLHTMDYDQIEDTYNTYVNYDYATATPEKQRMKSAFIDALIVTGSNPAVLFVLKAIINAPIPLPNYIQTYPFYVKVPGEKLIREIYNLTKSVDKTVKGFEFYSNMWLAFGTLLHRGCENVAGIHDDGFHHTHHHKFVVDPETCKTFSIDIYNRFVGATTTAEKILFVKVLGNMALRDNYVYLKPIVNGEQFQPEAVRLNAFWSLAHYAGDLKEEVLTLVVPVFKNYSEPVEIRISAFELMLYTDPITLDFLIEILHNEPYNQVSSYIYSTLKTYANSTQPCDYKIAKLSRKLLAVLEPKKFGLHYSNQVYYDYYNDKYAFGGSNWLGWVGSNESIIPESIYLEQSANILGYNFDYFSFGFKSKGFTKRYIEPLFSGFSPFTADLKQYPFHDKASKPLVKKELDEIFKTLNWETPKKTKTEIEIEYASFGQNIAFSYLTEEDLTSLMKFEPVNYDDPNWFKRLNFEKKINYQKTTMLVDTLYILPTELGLPLVFHLEVPVYISVTGDVKFNVLQLSKNTPLNFPDTFQLTTNLKPIMHAKGVTKVHFLTPFLNSIGYATVDNVIVKLPLNLDLQYDLNDKKFSVKYEPSKAAYEMFHYDVKPLTYTKTYPNINYTPLPIVYNPEPHVLELKVGHTHFGAGLKVYRKQEQDWDSFSSYYKYFTSFFTKKSRTFDAYKYPYNTIEKLMQGFMSMSDYYMLYPTMKPYEFKLFFEPNPETPTSEYDLTVSFNKFYKQGADVYEPDHSKPALIKLDPTFRKVYGVSVDLIAKGTVQRSYHGDFNISYTSTGRFPTKFTLDYWRTPVPNYDSNPFKLCYRASLTIPKYTKFFAIDKDTEQKAEFDENIFFGKDCETDKKFVINTVITKTDKQKKYDDVPTMSKAYNKCEEDKKYGYNYTKACRKYFLNYYTLKQYDIDIKYDYVPQFLGTTLDEFTNYFKYLFYFNIVKLDKYATTNQPGHIKIKANFSSDPPARVDLKVYKPNQTVYYKDIYYPSIIPFFQNFNVRRTPLELYFKKVFQLAAYPSCSIQKNYTETFDGVVYHAPLSTCYQLVTTAFYKPRFTILTKKVEHKIYTVAVKLFVVNHKIEILPVGETPTTAPLVLRIDDVKQSLPSGSLYYVPDVDRKDKTAFKIYNLYDTYMIEIPTLDMTVIYDGTFLKVMVPNFARGQVYGLCGDFNGETAYEFVGPNGCVYTDEKSFVKSYVVPDGSCTPPTTDKLECFYPYAPTYPGKCTVYLNKVIHDVSTDRTGRTSNNACFSTAPIPQCLPGCKPSTDVKRKFGFHCLNKRDSYTSLLIEASGTRELPEIRYKSEDYHEIVEYPEYCVKA